MTFVESLAVGLLQGLLFVALAGLVGYVLSTKVSSNQAKRWFLYGVPASVVLFCMAHQVPHFLNLRNPLSKNFKNKFQDAAKQELFTGLAGLSSLPTIAPINRATQNSQEIDFFPPVTPVGTLPALAPVEQENRLKKMPTVTVQQENIEPVDLQNTDSSASCLHPSTAPSSCPGDCSRIMSFILEKRPKMTWNQHYDYVTEFVGRHNPNRVAVEIGTTYGGLADRLLQRIPALEVHAVDPFIAGYDTKDAISDMYNSLRRSHSLNSVEFPKIYAQALAYDLGRVRYGCRFHLHRASSTEVGAAFDDRSVGVLYVDGLHTEAAVEADIATWIPKMVPGGFMIFHDYGSMKFPGVKVAVDKLAQSWQKEVASIGPELVKVVFLQVPPAR